MGRIGDVGENGQDTAGDEIARVQAGVSRGGDQGWSADAACSKSQASQVESGQPPAGTRRAVDWSDSSGPFLQRALKLGGGG